MIRSSLLATVCVLALGATACGGGNDDGDDATDYAQGATYTEPVTSDPGNLHPLRVTQNVTGTVLAFAYDSLVSISDDGKITGQLAESWKVTPKRVTFTLRPGITCGDGTELTATDVANTFEWVKDPKNKATIIGENLPSPDYKVVADDAARTVAITLEQPFGFLLEGAGTVWIVCPKGLADPKSLAHETDGTGPFELVDYVADDHLTFEVRKGYTWGPDGAGTSEPGTPRKVVFRVIQNLTTQANLLLSGELSSATITGPDAGRIEGQGFADVKTQTGPTDLFYNQRSGHPGADPKVREALTRALDLDQLIKVLTEGSGTRPTSLVILPPRPCHNDTTEGALPAHDLEAAKALLDEAGWTAGPDGTRAKDGEPLAVTLAYLTGQTPLSAGMELIGGWWKELGVDVKLKGMDANAYTQSLFGGDGDWDVAVLGVALPYPNQFSLYATGPASPEGQNFAAIENADYERLAQQALGTTGEEGCDLWAQAEQALFENVDVVPLSADVVSTFAKSARLALGQHGTEPTSVRMLAR